MGDFLDSVDRQQASKAVSLAELHGEIAGLAYRVQGVGPPLLLLPLSLAPSQWDPVLPALGEHYSTITLGGPHLGMVALLESRARSGYGRLVRAMLDLAGPRPGERVLEVGCGSGALVRGLAERTAGANPIVGTDLNGYLVREAAALARQAGLDPVMSFQEADAEALCFPDGSFDVAFSSTVLEEGNADRMLAELARVTKPGGRVAVINRAIDFDWWVNLPLPADLGAKLNALGPGTGAGVGDAGCADASLYRRLNQAGLRVTAMGPRFAIYDEGERRRSVLDRLVAPLSAEEARICRDAVTLVEADGTYFIAEPFHCAIGLKR